jgi:DNA gyrase subunit A
LLVVTDAGIAYGIPAYQIPTSSRSARGQPFPQLLPQLKIEHAITAILPVSEFNTPDEFLVLTTENGWIKKTSLAAFDKLSARGLGIATLEPGDRLKWFQRCPDGTDILIGTSLGLATRFPASALRPTSRTSRGVRAVNLREGDKIADVNVVPSTLGKNATAEEEYVLAVSSRGFGKRLSASDFRARARGGRGILALKFKKSSSSQSSSSQDTMACLRAVKESDEVMVITTKGIMVRQQVSVIPTQSRSATGVLIQKLDEGDHILSVSIVPEYEEME